MAKRRPSTSPVLASYLEMGKVLPRLEEAVSVKKRGASAKMKPLDRARMLGAFQTAFEELRKAPVPRGVMQASRDQFASLLQSAFAEHAKQAGRVAKVKGVGTREAKFDTQDPGWVSVAWEKLKAAWSGRIAFSKPGAPTRIPAQARLAVFGDWATGLYGAPLISRSIKTDTTPADAVLHLGDTYYSGTDTEFAERFVPFWPKVPKAIHRSLNGNHEMYSGGQAFLKTIRAEFEQNSTVFALENDAWLLIGLDTALDDHDLNPEQVLWLKQTLKAAEGRKVVLFSHHQPFSRFESQGPNLVAHLKPWLDKGRIFAWYWGHEHRCILYAKHARWQMWGRCVGHGGMPDARDATLGRCPKKPSWRRFQALGSVPACQLLDGPNPFISLHENHFLPHGFAILTLDDDRLIEEYRDPNGNTARPAFELT
jgi:calcineurin-like phosphoesterase family protein